MKFIGRINELEKIKSELNKDEFSFSLIYGRRVGKSELVKEAIRENNIINIYYECKQVSQESNVKSLCEIVSEQLGLPQLGYNDMESLLKYLFELSRSKSFCLILDEYSYLKDSVKGMDSILQSLIDHNHESSKMKMIILGSYIDIMKSLVEKSNPLYGRFDCIMELKPMDYYDSSLFYPNYSTEDKVRIYSVFGGIPYYNKMINDNLSVKENIINLLVEPGSRLENEVPAYLKAELSKITNANETIEAMARGFTKSSDIRDRSHVSSNSTLFDVLEKLIKMEIVEKSVPINDKTEKKTGYTISDNLSLFYYRYIFRYFSQRSIMNAEVFYDKYIANDFETQYVPHQFEKICKQYLIRMNRLGKKNLCLKKLVNIITMIEKIKQMVNLMLLQKTNMAIYFMRLNSEKNLLQPTSLRKKLIRLR